MYLKAAIDAFRALLWFSDIVMFGGGEGDRGGTGGGAMVWSAPRPFVVGWVGWRFVSRVG